MITWTDLTLPAINLWEMPVMMAYFKHEGGIDSHKEISLELKSRGVFEFGGEGSTEMLVTADYYRDNYFECFDPEYARQLPHPGTYAYFMLRAGAEPVGFVSISQFIADVSE